jgi:site-specific DNA-cytosine methylase
MQEIVFGNANLENASNAGHSQNAINEAIKCITSNRGQPMLNSDSPIQTWLSSALLVIGSFIPARTQKETSVNLYVDVERDYLDIYFRGKPASDSVKYKALGNSMAVPVIRWIGKRIELIESIKEEEGKLL